MITENQGFDYKNLIEGHRDYGLFFLLAGVRGNDNTESYPPISLAKGLPTEMDDLIKKYYENYYTLNFEHENLDCHHASYLTLNELKNSGYGDIMRLHGWVQEDEYNNAVNLMNIGKRYQLNFEDVNCNEDEHQGLVLKEWDGYINLNLTYMIEKMEQLMNERSIESLEDIRIVFWFDN
jgi:hypothetical protein